MPESYNNGERGGLEWVPEDRILPVVLIGVQLLLVLQRVVEGLAMILRVVSLLHGLFFRILEPQLEGMLGICSDLPHLDSYLMIGLLVHGVLLEHLDVVVVTDLLLFLLQFPAYSAQAIPQDHLPKKLPYSPHRLLQ